MVKSICMEKKSVMSVVVMSLLARLTETYSKLLEMKLSNGQTLHLLNAQLAGVSSLLFCESVVGILLCLAWFALAVRGCAKAFRAGK